MVGWMNRNSYKWNGRSSLLQMNVRYRPTIALLTNAPVGYFEHAQFSLPSLRLQYSTFFSTTTIHEVYKTVSRTKGRYHFNIWGDPWNCQEPSEKTQDRGTIQKCSTRKCHLIIPQTWLTTERREGGCNFNHSRHLQCTCNKLSLCSARAGVESGFSLAS